MWNGKPVLDWSDDDIAAAVRVYQECQVKDREKAMKTCLSNPFHDRARCERSFIHYGDAGEFRTELVGVISAARDLVAQRKAKEAARIELENQKAQKARERAEQEAQQERERAEQEAQRKQTQLREQAKRDREAAEEARRLAETEEPNIAEATKEAEEAQRTRQAAEQRLAEIRGRVAEEERRAFEAERAKRESEATALIPQKAPSRETPPQSPPPQTPAQRKAQPSNADFLNLMAATGCKSKYSEQKRADLFAAQKGRQMTVTGEITEIKGGRVLLKVLRDTITYDIGVTLADENAAYNLEKGRVITVSFILTQHGGCFLPYGGTDGQLVAVSR